MAFQIFALFSDCVHKWTIDPDIEERTRKRPIAHVDVKEHSIFHCDMPGILHS
jgi:hypothetical protein